MKGLSELSQCFNRVRSFDSGDTVPVSIDCENRIIPDIHVIVSSLTPLVFNRLWRAAKL